MSLESVRISDENIVSDHNLMEFIRGQDNGDIPLNDDECKALSIVTHYHPGLQSNLVHTLSITECPKDIPSQSSRKHNRRTINSNDLDHDDYIWVTGAVGIRWPNLSSSRVVFEGVYGTQTRKHNLVRDY